MIQLIERDSKIRSCVGYKNRNFCEKELSGLNELRNSVMHPSNSLVRNYDGVKKLCKRIERLRKATERIEDAYANV